jgi:geranylgeranyl reductase family protein
MERFFKKTFYICWKANRVMDMEEPASGWKYDAIVVGAGPSGCSCALYLANAGKRVLLLDKAEFPREKVCGDAFSGKSIGVARELGVLPSLERLPHGIVRGLALISPSGKRVEVPFPNAPGLPFAGYTIERRELDSAFFTAALSHKKITVIKRFQAESLERGASGAVCGVSGVALPGREAGKFSARVVVGADGAASMVSRVLSQKSQPVEHVYSAVRGYYSGVEGLSENIELYFIDGVLPGYLWIFPMADGKANVGLGILSSDLQKRGKHPNAMLQWAVASHPSLAQRFKPAKLVGKIGGWAIPNGSYLKPNTGDGWLLVGDAASLVDPFSGEGVGNALASGKYAAQAIAAALGAEEGGSPLSAKSLASYEKSVSEFLRPELNQSYTLQRLSRFRFLLNLFIGKAADKPEVRNMLVGMLGSDEEKKKVVSPFFYLKLLLP